MLVIMKKIGLRYFLICLSQLKYIVFDHHVSII